jgi:CHAT domain-containing protein/tetratricopeptide (TPR) repeat protein
MMKTIAATAVLALLPLTFLFAQMPDTAWIRLVTHQVRQAMVAGDFEQGRKICTQALDSARMRYGPDSEAEGDLLDIMGYVQMNDNDYVGFEQSAAKCVEIWTRAYGPRALRTAHGLSQLGFARFHLGRYETVEALLTEARSITLEKGRGRTDGMADICSHLATYYQTTGYYLKAEPLLIQALDLAADLYGERSMLYARFANNLAAFYSVIERGEEALRYYDLCLAALGQYVGPTHPYHLRTQSSKGRLLADVGRYRESESLLKATLETARMTFPVGSLELCTHINNLSLLYQKIGQYDEALRLMEENMGLLKAKSGEADPDYLKSRLNLAVLYRDRGRLAAADTLLREVILIQERNRREQTLLYAQALVNLGLNLQRQQRFEEARAWLEKAVGVAEQTMGADHPTFHWTYGMALVRQHLAENNPDEALRLLKGARPSLLATYGSRHEKYIGLESLYGRAWQLKGNPDRALGHFRDGFEALRYNLAENFAFLSIAQRENFIRTYEEYQTSCHAFAHAFRSEPKVRAFLFDLALFHKELLGSYDRRLLAAWQQNPDSVFLDYVETRRMIALQWTLSSKDRHDLPALEARKERLEKQLSMRSLETNLPAALPTAHWQQVQQALQPGDVAIEWLTLPATPERRDADRYAALLLRPGRAAPELVLLSAAAEIDGLFAARGGRGLVYAGRTYGGSALFDRLWKPLEPSLEGALRIFYAPTAGMHLLNFDAIPLPDGRMLSEKYRLVRLTNTARLLDARRENLLAGNAMVLLAGGLDYEAATAEPVAAGKPGTARTAGLWRGASGVREWSPLPETLAEVENLARMLEKQNMATMVLTGPGGSESAVKARCSGAEAPAVLHFATHGFFFEKDDAGGSGRLSLAASENPMFRSGLILAGANPAWRGESRDAALPSDDGILTAEEISLLDLRRTALVVLSACETGLGEVRDDEGVYGLQRAFRLAGAHTIVMSLWRVPDAPTRVFMEKFYAALLPNGDVRAAFAAARQAMRREYEHPYYWAGFVLLE